MDKQIVILNMKSRFLLSVVFFGMIAGLSASPVYRMGSYNIRGENAADTGDKDWNVRKEYVVRNIVEHDFDVVGLQENSIKMLPQLEELLGDDYATHSWGAISETSGTHTTIVYKAGKFTLLDKGQYFLTSNPAAPDLSWDTAVRRNTVWVKLQDKTTGDVFFYFSTHLDHKYNPQIQISEKSQTKRLKIADSRKTKRPIIDKRTTPNKRHSNAIITL